MAAVQQAREIENVLQTVVQCLLNYAGKCEDIIWGAVLKFLLNATDLLLSGETCLGWSFIIEFCRGYYWLRYSSFHHNVTEILTEYILHVIKA